MEKYIVYLIIGAVIIISYFIYLILNKKKKQEVNVKNKMTDILALIEKENIKSIEYVRNKIVISFKDVTKFNVEELHNLGVLGINIVGDKVKFYVEEDKTQNENIFQIIKDHIYGK